MKTPPLLLGAALLFWGWQTDFLVAGILMAAVLEGSRFIPARWDLSDEDFSRIWTFCTLLLLAAAVYAFTDNGGPARFSSLFANFNPANQSRAGAASARTAASMLRWLPMVLFLFAAAQAYSTRPRIPLTTISLLLRVHRKRAAQLGRPLPAAPTMNVSYPYLAVCLFAASVHSAEDDTYFWGLCALMAWALWSQRSRRIAIVVWASVFALVILLGYAGQRGIGELQNLIQNLDSRLLAAFVHRNTDPTQNRTSLDEVSRMKGSGKILIRLKPKDGGSPPPYLREAVYRTFASPNWLASTHKAGYQGVYQDTNGTTWILLPGKSDSAAVTIACYLEDRSRESDNPAGLLPLPAGCSRLEDFPGFALRIYSAGAVMAEGPGFVQFDAIYGPGATLGSAPTNDDGIVPAGEKPALDRVISELRLEDHSRDAILGAVKEFFDNHFKYSLAQETPPEAGSNETDVAQFLLRTRTGHCEYFATATVLLLRELGLQARYAVGYVVHEPAGRGYVVRARDAHAWCLVWNEATQAWEDFDTTPASWVELEANEASIFQWLSDGWSWIRFQISKFRWGQTRFRQYILLAMLPVLAFLFYQIFFRRKRARKTQSARTAEAQVAWPGLDSEFYLIERRLAAHGIARRINEPLSEWLQRALKESALIDLRLPLAELLHLHYRCRFDPRGLDPQDRESLKRGAESVLAALEKK